MNAEMKNSQNSQKSFGKPAQVGFVAGSGNGFSMPKPPVQKTEELRPQRIIIRKKKSPVSFERRFLSARSKNGGNAQLEIAMIWRGNVVDVRKFGLKDVTSIMLGSDKSCTFNVETGMAAPVTIAHRTGDQWSLLFDNSFGGFILQGDKKTEFKTASTGNFEPAVVPGSLAGALSCKVQGDTRAKYVFGEVTVLVHYVDAVSFAMPMIGSFKANNFAAIAASLLVHLAFFSVVFFSTDRVNALMVDRVLTMSRFVEFTEPQPEPETPDMNNDIDEPDVETPTPVAVQTPSQTSKSSNKSNPTGGPIGKTPTVQIPGGGRGLLADGRMDSIMGAFNDNNIFDATNKWNTFDPGVSAKRGGFLLDQTGTCPGGVCGTGPGVFRGKVGGDGPNAITSKVPQSDPIIPEKEPGVIPMHTKTKVEGSLDRITIQKTVNRHKGELKGCYERELAKVKNLHGRITALWYITPEGNVSAALVKDSTMHNPNVEKCIIDSIRFWRFPAPKGGGSVEVEYPFVFEVGK